MHPLIFTNIETTEFGRFAIVIDELDGGGFTGYSHKSKSKVLLNKGGIVHESGNIAHEIKDLIRTASITTGKVLAAKLSDPDGFVKGKMHVGYVVSKGLGVSSVPMQTNGINLAATAAGQEALYPLLARWSVGARGRDEEITLIFERVEELPPEIRAMLRRHVGLTDIVRLIETQSILCVAGLDQVGKVANFIITPQHRATVHANLVSEVDTKRAPSVVLVNFRCLKVLDRGVVTQGPGNANLGS